MKETKQMLVDAIIGCGFKTIDFACDMQSKRLAQFIGNQWNEEWKWCRSSLEGMDEESLNDLYDLAKRE